MQIFKKRISKKVKLEITLVALAVLVIAGYVFWDMHAGGPLTSLFSDRDRLINAVRSLGIFGPLLYMILQIVQSVVAPIPGNIVGGIGGFLFGWWGVLWTLIGSTIGAGIIFYVSRRFGRTFVEKFVKKDALNKFDFVFGRRATLILFLIYLIPGLPDDVICYIAGLTDVPIKRLIALWVIGRLPAVIVNNYIGAGLSDGNVKAVAIISAITAVLLLIIYLQREKIMELLDSTSKKTKKTKGQQ